MSNSFTRRELLGLLGGAAAGAFTPSKKTLRTKSAMSGPAVMSAAFTEKPQPLASAMLASSAGSPAQSTSSEAPY